MGNPGRAGAPTVTQFLRLRILTECVKVVIRLASYRNHHEHFCESDPQINLTSFDWSNWIDLHSTVDRGPVGPVLRAQQLQARAGRSVGGNSSRVRRKRVLRQLVALGASRRLVFQVRHQRSGRSPSWSTRSRIICGEDVQTNPQGKIHSDIVEANGWLYMATHFAAEKRGVYETWTGSHALGYELATGRWRDYGVVRPVTPATRPSASIPRATTSTSSSPGRPPARPPTCIASIP